MQLILTGKGTGDHTLTTTAFYVPITVPVMALGVTKVGGLVEVAAGLSSTINAQLAYRFFANDDSQSAGSWTDVSTAQAGPGKVFKSGSVASVDGMYIQLGIKLSMSSGSTVGRAFLRKPILVTE